jgi:hypothetical protein
MWSGMMFCALGVFAGGSLAVLADVGFLHSIAKAAPQHVLLVVRLLVTAVIALPLSLWLFFRADRLPRGGRVGVCVIALFLVALNLELMSVVFAVAALVASIWLLRRPRVPLALL